MICRSALLFWLVACSKTSPSKVELIAAPAQGDVASYVAGEVARGARDGVPVLVYVGATWCPPCVDFHDAVVSGKLDDELGRVRFLELDVDRDNTRLLSAGYESDAVPLFARPTADGRSSGMQTAGVEKGGRNVEQLVPRIRALIR